MSEAYKASGVNIEAGYEAVERIKHHVKRTERPFMLGGIGAFGAAVDLSSLSMKEPVLISGTDGVGTKLMLAIELDKHDTIGIDAVAMCVNDIVTQGAEPLYFLDYIACGALNPEKIEAIVKGIADGCVLAGTALIGGETAEMPGMYQNGHYDLAGFTVGAVEKSERLTGEQIKPGDRLIGLASSGIHSNGFSLVRKIVEDAKVDLQSPFPGSSRSVGDVLLTPTRVYVKTVLALLETKGLNGIAHITGGGLYENVPRMLPEGLGAVISKDAWKVPEVFNWLKSLGQLNDKDLFNTFNMGIGMVLAVSPEKEQAILEDLKSLGEAAWTIGTVEASKEPIVIQGVAHD